MKIKTIISGQKNGMMQVEAKCTMDALHPCVFGVHLGETRWVLSREEYVRGDTGDVETFASVTFKGIPHKDARAFAAKVRADVRKLVQEINADARAWNESVKDRKGAPDVACGSKATV